MHVLSLRNMQFESQGYAVSKVYGFSHRNTWFGPQKYLVLVSEIPGFSLRNNLVWVPEISCSSLRNTWFEPQKYLVLVSEIPGLSLRNIWFLVSEIPGLSLEILCFQSQKYPQKYLVWAQGILGFGLRKMLLQSHKYVASVSKISGFHLRLIWFKFKKCLFEFWVLRFLYPQGTLSSQNLPCWSLYF